MLSMCHTNLVLKIIGLVGGDVSTVLPPLPHPDMVVKSYTHLLQSVHFKDIL